MSTKLQIIKVKLMEKILFHLGFAATRQSGSHVFYRHPDGRFTTLPHHGNQDLGRGLICEILKEINISKEEYATLLDEVK